MTTDLKLHNSKNVIVVKTRKISISPIHASTIILQWIVDRNWWQKIQEYNTTGDKFYHSTYELLITNMTCRTAHVTRKFSAGWTADKLSNFRDIPSLTRHVSFHPKVFFSLCCHLHHSTVTSRRVEKITQNLVDTAFPGETKNEDEWKHKICPQTTHTYCNYISCNS